MWFRRRRLQHRLHAIETAVSSLSDRADQIEREMLEIERALDDEDESVVCEDCEAILATGQTWLYPCRQHAATH